MGDVQNIVESLVRENAFRAAVLTDEFGLPLGSFPTGALSEAPAATVAQIRRLFDRVHRRVGLRTMEEVALRDDAGQRLICRRIVIDEHDLILAVLVPPGRPSREAIDQAVEGIRETFSSMGEDS